jgi:ribonuclease HI
MPEFTCRDCGASFTLSESVLARYPGWTPRQCNDCRGGSASPRRRSSTARNKISTQEVLAGFAGGPQSGVFTDGGASPNPGPGGWGAVYVVEGEIVAEQYGAEPHTTNNRMELTALLAALELVPEGTPATVLSDSRLAVQTITEWAAGWEKRGWKRKTGPVENLDLVKPVFYGFRRRPELELTWIEAHAGHRWNEYADALANRWRT